MLLLYSHILLIAGNAKDAYMRDRCLEKCRIIRSQWIAINLETHTLDTLNLKFIDLVFKPGTDQSPNIRKGRTETDDSGELTSVSVMDHDLINRSIFLP